MVKSLIVFSDIDNMKVSITMSVLVDFVHGLLCLALSEMDVVYVVVVVTVGLEFGEVFSLINELRVCDARSGEVRRGDS